jgi:hydrogenase nickel incorporation protein HypA/HybF
VHELGLCQALEAVERRATRRRMTGVKVRVGTFHRVVEPALDQAFTSALDAAVTESPSL